jgi:hypothetical protein
VSREPATAKVAVLTPDILDVAMLCHGMRPDEIDQWLALSGLPHYDADQAGRAIIATLGPFASVLVDRERKPIVVGGFVEERRGVFQTWMVGTPDGWATYWREITRWSRRAMDAMFRDHGAHRIQTHALASRTAAHEWYERGLGMTREGTLRRYFANGADAVVYSKVNP